jgi:hypothetical protein
MKRLTNVVVERRVFERPLWLTRERIALYSAAALVCQLILIGIWAASCWVLHIESVPPLGIDFRVFWSTSFLSLHDGALAAFDPHLLSATEDSLRPKGMFAPWVYPPTFQLIVYPLALLPYAASYFAFVCIGIGIGSCLIACRSAMRTRPLPWISVIAFPGIWVAVICGQNSLITLALAAGALGLLERRPILAGMCAGALVIKPQLAVLLPLLFLCGRHFRAFGAMAATAVSLCLVSEILFGFPVWLEFIRTLSWFDTVVLNDENLMRAMPTVFGIARRFGISKDAAYVVHAAFALPVVIATAILWIRRLSVEIRFAAAVVATLLAQPYLIYYDLAWLLLPIIYWSAETLKRGSRTFLDHAVLTVAWFLPLLSFIAVLKPWIGQWGPFLLITWFILILFRARDGECSENENKTGPRPRLT